MDRNPALIQQVRANAAIYMSPGRRVASKDLALELASDALYLGATEVRVLQFEDWTLVGASNDWIAAGSRWKPAECFFRLEFIHEFRKNANRATVVLGAFATDLVIFKSDEVVVVTGCDAGTSLLHEFVRAQLPLVRVVAFRLAPAPPAAGAA